MLPVNPRTRSRRTRLAQVAALLAVLIAVGVHGERGPETSLQLAVRASPDSSGPERLVATAIVPRLEVYDNAAAPSPARVLDNPTEVGAPLVLLAERIRGAWVKVLLPIRPNGSQGWVRAADVDLVPNGYRVLVKLSRHRVRVLRDDELVLDAPIAVGTRDTPTPGGEYYIKELLRPSDPDGVYGTYAYGLSGFSNELSSFANGDGVIGLHGTNDPSVIGEDVSHGCIRMRNEDIERLVPLLPLGTPVRIRA